MSISNTPTGWGGYEYNQVIDSRTIINPYDHKWKSPEELYTYMLTVGENDDTFIQVCRNLLSNYYNGKANGFHSSSIKELGYECEDFTWLIGYCNIKGMVEKNNMVFYKFNENNLPIGIIDIAQNGFSGVGTDDFINDIMEESAKHFTKKDWSKVSKKIVELNGFSEEGPNISTNDLGEPLSIKDEYYPYLKGGFHALMEDFLKSPDPLLILSGVPGTGKSNGIFSSINEFNLIPIIARDFQAIQHKSFINSIFSIHDSIYSKGEGVKEIKNVEWKKYFEPHCRYFENNPRPFMDISVRSNKAHRTLISGLLGGMESNDENDNNLSVDSGTENYIPVIIIEDADALLRPRTEGNMVMQNLLNRLDGIGNQYPVKVIMTVNLEGNAGIDKALLRPGRCYSHLEFRELTADEAIAARAACGYPPLEELGRDPTKRYSLAYALQVPRKRIMI